MSPRIAKAVILVAFVVMVGIRARPALRTREVRVAKSRVGIREIVLSMLATVGVAVPLIWVATPVLSFAEHPAARGRLIAGSVCLAVGLWLLYRSHADLGAYFSHSLEMREQHRLITAGVYRRVRHPIYLAFLLYALGQLLVVPNWVAGPSALVTFVLLLVFRIPEEERMMLEEFGEEYSAYMASTPRLFPGVW